MWRGTSCEKRAGVIVHVISDKGVMGFGEASPLEGASPELLKKAVHQLEQLKGELCGVQVPLAPDDLLHWLEARFTPDLVAPSVRFALESAILFMAADVRGTTPAEYLTGAVHHSLFSAAFLHGSYRDVLGQAAECRSSGQKLFELVVGNANIPLDVQKVEGLKDLLGVDAHLRLCGGGDWEAQEAMVFGQSIGGNQIDYWQEPCRDPRAWEEIARRVEIPLAIAESRAAFSDDDLERVPALRFFVIRPMFAGGVCGTLSLIKEARRRGQRVVVAGLLESGVGQAMLSNLAAISGEPVGIGSSAWLERDLLEEPVMSSSGLILPTKLSLSPALFCRQFRDKLQAA